MIIEISKDIEKYKESVVMGLTAKQVFFSIASLGAGAATVLLAAPYVGLQLAAFIAIPIVAPIAIGGFYNYHGMSIYEVMRLRMHFLFHNPGLYYESSENPKILKKIEKGNGGGLLGKIFHRI